MHLELLHVFYTLSVVHNMLYVRNRKQVAISLMATLFGLTAQTPDLRFEPALVFGRSFP